MPCPSQIFRMQPASPHLLFMSGIAETAIASGLFRTLGYPLQKTIEKALFPGFISFILYLVCPVDIFFHKFSHSLGH